MKKLFSIVCLIFLTSIFVSKAQDPIKTIDKSGKILDITYPHIPKMELFNSGTMTGDFMKKLLCSNQLTIGGFYMSKYEITNSQFIYFLNERMDSIQVDSVINYEDDLCKIYLDSTFKVEEGFENYPVNFVSYQGAKLYCEWLTNCVNDIAVQNGEPEIFRFRIPSQVEWIYATSSKTNNQTKITNLVGNKEANKIAWFAENSQDQLHEVGKKKNNQGIYDLNGNVSEWCTDLSFECGVIWESWGHYEYKESVDSVLVLGGNYQSKKEELYLETEHQVSKKGMFSTVGIRIVQTYWDGSSGDEF